jgi:tape measure domain-containing protein
MATAPANDGTVSFSIGVKDDSSASIDKIATKVSSLDKLINSINKVEMTINFSQATLSSFKSIEDNIKKMSDGFEALGKDYSKAMLEGAKMARIEMETQGKLQIEKEKQKTQELVGINKAASNAIVNNAIETADKINEANKKVKAPTFDLDANKAIIDLKNSFALQKQALDSGNKELYAAQSEAVEKLLALIPESNKKSILLYRQTAALKLVESKRAMQLEIEAEAEKNKKIVAAVDEGKKIIAAKDAEAARNRESAIKKENDAEVKAYNSLVKSIEDAYAKRNAIALQAFANEMELGKKRIAEAKRVEAEIAKTAEETQKKTWAQAGMMLGSSKSTAPTPTSFSGMPAGLSQNQKVDATGMLLGSIKPSTVTPSANQALPSGLGLVSDLQKKSIADNYKAIEDNNKKWLEGVKQVSTQMEKDELYLRSVRRASIEMERNDRLKAIKEAADAQAREDRIISRQAALNSTWMGRQGTTSTNQPAPNTIGTTSALNAVSDSLGKVQSALMLVGVAMSGRQVLEYADNWLHFVNAVGIATEKTGGAAQMQEKLFKLAQDNRAPLEAITSIYLRMSRAAETLNITQGETVKMIDVVTKSLAIMGTSPSAVRGGLLQLEQALGGVTVRGQEFKSILDSMPNVMATVAKHYQDAAKDIKLQEASLRGASEAELDKIKSEKTHELSISALRNMMYQGEVASAAFAKAIIMGQDEIDATFEKTHKTFAQAFQTIENGFTKWVGQLNQGTEASDKFYRMAQQIADNFNIVVGVIGAATAAVGAYALSFAGIAIAINPVGAAIAVIAGLTAGFALLKDEIKVTGEGLSTWGDVFEVVTDRLGDSISSWMTKLGDFKDWLDKKFPNAKQIAGNAMGSVDNVVQKIYDLSPTGVAGNWISDQIDSAAKEAEKKAQERAYKTGLPTQEEKAFGTQMSSMKFGLSNVPNQSNLSASNMLSKLTPSGLDAANVGFSNDEQGRLNKKRYDEARQAREDEIAQLTAIAKKQSEVNNEELRRLGLSEKEQFILKEMDKDLEKQRTTIKDGTKVRFDDLESYKKHLTDIGINYDEIYRKQYASIFAEKESFTERKKANDEAKRWSEPEAKAQTLQGMDTAIKGVRDEISTLSNELTNFSAKHPLSLSVSIDKNKALSEVAQFKDMFEKSGTKYGVSPSLLASMAVQESHGNTQAVSYAGAKSGLGLMQIGESTAQTYKLALKDRLDPEKSIETAAKIMADLLKTFNGDVRLALAAYNAGKGRVQGVQGDVSKLTMETRKFAPEILGRLNGENGAQSKELVTLQQKLNELKNKEVELAKARNAFDAAPSRVSKKDFDLAQGALKETEKEYKNAVQTQKEFESANKSVIEALDKQTEAAYGTAHAYDFLKERQSISVEAKTLGMEKGGFAIPEIDAMLKQITDKENELSKASAKAVAELETAKSLAIAEPTQANFEAEVAALNKKLALESEIANAKKQASDVSRIELDLLQQQANVIPNLKRGNDDLMESLTSSTVELEKQKEIRKQGATGAKVEEIRSLIDTRETLKGLNDIKSTVTGTLSSSFSTMFSDVLTRGKSFTSAFRDMFKNMVASISQGLMNVAMQALMTGNFIVAGLAAAGSIITGLMGALFKGSYKDLSTPDTKVSGTVKGNTELGSSSVSSIVDTLNSIHSKEYRSLQDIADGFKNTNNAIGNVVSIAVANNGNFSGSTKGMTSGNTGASEKQFLNGLMIAAAMGGIGLLMLGVTYGLSKLLGIGKVKYEAIGYGIVSNATEMILGGANKGITVYNYSKIKRTVKGWFSDDVLIYDVINGINKDLTVAVSSVFRYFNKSLYEVINGLGIGNLVDPTFIVPKIKLSFTKLKSDEINKKITESLNTTMDNIVADVTNGFISPFQKMGEGLHETIARIGIDVNVVYEQFKKIGSTISVRGIGLITMSENLINLFESTNNANDGLKNFITAIDAFYNAVTSKGEQFTNDAAYLSSKIADINKQGLLLASAPTAKNTLTTDAISILSKSLADPFTKVADTMTALGSDTLKAYAKQANTIQEIDAKGKVVNRAMTPVELETRAKTIFSEAELSLRTGSNRFALTATDLKSVTAEQLKGTTLLATLDAKATKEITKGSELTPNRDVLFALIDANKTLATNVDAINKVKDIIANPSTYMTTANATETQKTVMSNSLNSALGTIDPVLSVLLQQIPVLNKLSLSTDLNLLTGKELTTQFDLSTKNSEKLAGAISGLAVARKEFLPTMDLSKLSKASSSQFSSWLKSMGNDETNLATITSADLTAKQRVGLFGDPTKNTAGTLVTKGSDANLAFFRELKSVIMANDAKQANLTKILADIPNELPKFVKNTFTMVDDATRATITEQLTGILSITDISKREQAFTYLTDKYGEWITASDSATASIINLKTAFKSVTDYQDSVIRPIAESILAKSTTADETTARANEASLKALNTTDDITTLLNSISPDLTKSVESWISGLDTTTKANYGITDAYSETVDGVTTMHDAVKITTRALKAYDNQISLSSTAVESFRKSVSDWVLGKMTTTVGSPESQFNASKVAFESMLSILNNPNANSATDVANAQSKITGYADTFITNIQKMYGAGDVGANLVQDVVNKVSNLGAVDYQTTMLEKTTQIADNTAKMADKATSTTTDAATTKALDSVSALTTVVNDIIAAPTGTITLDPYAVTANPSWSNISVSEMATVKPAANDSSTNTAETIAELKLQNEQLAQLVVETRALVTVQAEANATVVAQLTDLVSTSQEDTFNNRMRALAG